MASKIEQIVEEIETYIAECKPQALSNTKIIVNKAELEVLLQDLRLQIPEEIRTYQKIIVNKDAILQDSRAKGERIIDEAKIKAQDLVSEHEITQEAYKQANDIVEEATREAEEIREKAEIESREMREGVLMYSNEVMANLESLLTKAINDFSGKSNEVLGVLTSSYDTISKNRDELNASNNNL